MLLELNDLAAMETELRQWPVLVASLFHSRYYNERHVHPTLDWRIAGGGTGASKRLSYVSPASSDRYNASLFGSCPRLGSCESSQQQDVGADLRGE